MGLDADSLPDIDWVAVPGGKFLFGEKKERELAHSFRIAHYPVTNQDQPLPEADNRGGGLFYPRGASPYGLQDVAGNVWEWGPSKRDKPEDTTIAGSANRELRSGSWYDGRDYARGRPPQPPPALPQRRPRLSCGVFVPHLPLNTVPLDL